MAVGIMILVLMLIRLVMRFIVKRPTDATTRNKFLDILAALYRQFIRRNNLFARMWYRSS